MDYRDTLNLPKTDFPMKANLPERENDILKFWKERSIYEKLQSRDKRNTYILHDGPPYANGHIHMGHALNKVLKDIIIKYKVMKGYYAPFVPGWDCHGLPIELQVDKNLGQKKSQVSIPEKRKLCKEYAETFVHIQREEFIRLGVFGDWDKPYLTMDPQYEAAIVREFFEFVKRGNVYRGKKPVHWCPSCVTALAEAEVEYAVKESPSIYVKFRITDSDVERLFPELKGMDVYFIIWTTTPWTLPANLALAVHPEIIYIGIEKENSVNIFASTLPEEQRVRLNLQGRCVLEIKGSELEGTKAHHPFIDRLSPVLLADFVSFTEGTGIVHIAPGHGEEDYELGIKYGLSVYAPVDDRGNFTEEAGELKGEFVFKANERIIRILEEKGAVLHKEKYSHSYPHCWRCKKPVIFRATEQWFISMEKNDLRRRCLEEIEKVKWIPSWGKDRIYNMMLHRPDWCISRQRSWGVPITIISCTSCGEYIRDERFFEKTLELISKKGSDVWFTEPVEAFLPEGVRCEKCGNSTFKKEMDILDVWFESGVSHAAVLLNDNRLQWPSDLYLEGSDQHRGWFQSSLIASTGTRDSAPYRAVLTHGFVVDGQGRKMSKSLGNVIAPDDVIKRSGAEIVRLWVSAEDYREDMRLSEEIINRLVEAYRKIRNTARFLLGNIYDFDMKDYSTGLLEIDRWAMSRLQNLIKKAQEAYERFEFHEVFHSIYRFCVNDMSAFYLDILKDRLYTFKADSTERRAAQWVLYNILSSITRLIAPVLSFTAEEIWMHMPGEKEESVFLSKFPEPDQRFIDNSLEERWQRLIAVRDEVNKALEIKRKEKLIGNSLEARVVIYAPLEYYELLSGYRDFLPYLFIVSQVDLRTDKDQRGFYESEEIKELSIDIEKAEGKKCERCWNWSLSVGRFNDHPSICERCYNVIR
ncbi:MAG: isoleucine--tRNA ligase [Thermodesulfovibrionales bacterium]|nr:isoleucine--tRNA ligase [Thermodesulfovibrionales bacterium]